MELIDKEKVVAEIEKKIANIKEYCLREGHDVKFDVVPEQLSHILSFINTLEVKDVDLEKRDIKNAFKAGYELGIQKSKGGQVNVDNDSNRFRDAPK